MPLIVQGINSKGGDSSSNTSTNPVIPNEEQIKAGVFDKKKDECAKPFAEQYNATPGPVIPDDKSVFENKLSREEQHAKAKELNEG